MLLLYFIAAGLLIGLVARGRLERLAGTTFTWAPLALGGLMFQVLLFSGPLAADIGAWGPPLYVASTAVVLVALLRNLTHPGFRLIAFGAGLNLLAIVANGGQMPASPEAWVALTGVAAVPANGFTNSVIVGPGSPIALLGDVFVLPRPIPFANVFSLGDVLIGLGAVSFVVQVMRRVTVAVGATVEAIPVATGRVAGQVPPSARTTSLVRGAEAALDG